VLRLLAYIWSFPTTCVGLLFLPLTIGGRARLVQGVLELHGPAIAWILQRLVPLPGGASAMTLGHVIVGRDAASLDRSRLHEHVHVQQAERWGPLFIPAYLVAAAMVWIRGGEAYRDNPFEREAYRRTQT
jgi:hypothetical protein